MQRADEHDCLVFRHVGGKDSLPASVELPAGLASSYWQPSPTHMIPPGQSKSFAVWWAFHYAHILRNGYFGVQLVLDGDRVVHRTCVVPPWFRWPFMSPEDLQASNSWTDPDYRGRGLAKWASIEVLRRHRDRTVWYVTQEWNQASVLVSQRSGFHPYGRAVRTKRLGVRLLGTLELVEGPTTAS
ncbi:MAG: GNAT family N-acetyltransferase [Candidatus Nanopelagicales bacterium]